MSSRPDALTGVGEYLRVLAGPGGTSGQNPLTAVLIDRMDAMKRMDSMNSTKLVDR